MTGGGPPCGIAGGRPPDIKPGISPALCQPVMPSLQTSVSGVTDPARDQVAKLGLGNGSLLLTIGCKKPSLGHPSPPIIVSGRKARESRIVTARPPRE